MTHKNEANSLLLRELLQFSTKHAKCLSRCRLRRKWKGRKEEMSKKGKDGGK
jgi:predicted metal-binding membrane protein